MTSVLLLDTSFAAGPIHDWLCQEGFDVWTIGNRPTDLLARRNPHRYLECDYSHIAEVQNHVTRNGIRYVVPGCTDVSIETAVRLSGIETCFDTPEVYHRLGDKDAFRALCEDLNLSAPQRIRETELPLHRKLIAKPTNSYSGKGIEVFDGADQAAASAALMKARQASHDGKALLETYVAGQLYSYSCFLERQQVSEAMVVREDGAASAYTVDTSYVVTDFPKIGARILKDFIERLATNLKLVDGLFHVQFIWDGTQPWLIEATRRCPGDLYPRLIELSTGIPYAARYASYFVKRSPPSNSNMETSRSVLRHTFSAAFGEYEGIWFDVPTPMLEFHGLLAVGREASRRSIIDRTAVGFIELGSNAELVDFFDRFRFRNAYQTQAPLKPLNTEGTRNKSESV